jgi:hypothetical protein
MTIEELPTFTIQNLEKEDGIPLEAHGRFDQLQNVVEGHCDFYFPPATFVEGKLSNLQSKTRTAIFTCKNEIEASSLQLGTAYRYFDGYWGERARLVLDPGLTWGEHDFVQKASNDHDHCAICWATISMIENTNHMRSSSGAAICHGCHQGYVLRRSIDFIVPSRIKHTAVNKEKHKS